jgi:hypothetical protein
MPRRASAHRAPATHGGLFATLYKLMILTGQRREEVAGMRCDELRGLDTKTPTWQLPAERTKNVPGRQAPRARRVGGPRRVARERARDRRAAPGA